MTSVQAAYDAINETARHFPDLCPAVSQPLIDMFVDILPASPALILSVGCGSGLLEAIILHAGQHRHRKFLDIRGVEVPDCAVTHLAEKNVLRVSNTLAVHQDAMLASAILFVYPRQANLAAMYLDASVGGALETFVWLGPRSDWHEMEWLLLAAFYKLVLVESPVVANYELLAIATMPRGPRK